MVITAQLEALRRTGIWKVADWDQFEVLLTALGYPTGHTHPTGDSVAERLTAAIEGLPEDRDSTATRLKYLFGVETGYRKADPEILTRIVRRNIDGLGEDENDDQAFKRRNRRAREKLAAQIIKLSNDRSMLIPQFTDGVPLVPREQEQSVAAWADSGQRILLVAGDTGNGKSTVALQALKTYLTPHDFAIVDGSSLTSLLVDMNDITQKMDFEFDRALTNFMHHLNVTMRVGRKLSDFILLVDNVEQWSTVSPLVMRNGPRLLITSEFRDLVPRDIPHQYLPIEPPSLDIARKIARFLRENESDKDIEDFVEAVGRKPRLIVDCLGMHNEREMPLRTMTLLIENEKSRVVQNRSKHERAVHILYEKYFNRLEARDHQAARCLLSVAFIGEGRTDATVGSLIIATYLATEYGIENPVHGSTWPNTGDVDPAIAVSLNVLMDRHLISRDNRSIYMHGITANLFRDIGETLAFTAYYAVILAYMTAWAAEMESIVARDPQVDDDWELTLWQERNRDQLMSFTQPWAVCLRRALIGMPLEHYYHLPQYRDTIVQHLSTYSYQAGTFADFEPLLRRALLGTSQVPMEADILNSLLESGYKAGIASREEYAQTKRQLSLLPRRENHPYVRLATEIDMEQVQYDHKSIAARITNIDVPMEELGAVGVWDVIAEHYIWIQNLSTALKIKLEIQRRGRFASLFGPALLSGAAECASLTRNDAALSVVSGLAERYFPNLTGERAPYGDKLLSQEIAAWQLRMTARQQHAECARAFREAAETAMGIGHKRTAMKHYAEALQLSCISYVSTKGGSSILPTPKHPDFQDMFDGVDELHLIDRMSVVALLANFTVDGFQSDSLALVEAALARSEKRQDMRTWILCTMAWQIMRRGTQASKPVGDIRARLSGLLVQSGRFDDTNGADRYIGGTIDTDMEAVFLL